jgi:DNA-binding PadR family transcriptional regulator
MTVALKLLAGSPDGVTEYFFKVVHGINRRTLDALVTAGFASATVEHLKQGFDVTRFHITQAGRDALGPCNS